MVFVAGRVGKANSKKINKKDGSQTTVLDFSVAESIRDSKAEKGRRTLWYSSAIFGKYAEAMAPYIIKGALLQISGDLKLVQFPRKDGGYGVDLQIENPSISLLGGGKREDATPAEAGVSTGGDEFVASADVDAGGLPFLEVPEGEIPFN